MKTVCLFIFLQQWTRFFFSILRFHFSMALWNIAGKCRRRKKTVEKLKLPLAWAVLMHVLHHTCVKVVEEEWRLKGISYFISPAVVIFHPIPPSPHLSTLWFSLSSAVFAERADCAGVSKHSKWVCVLWIEWGKLEITMSVGRVRPLCSLFHLFSLSVLASPDDCDALCRSPAGVSLLTPSRTSCILIPAQTHTYSM